LESDDLERAQQNFNKARQFGEITKAGRRFLVFGGSEAQDLEEYEAELQFRFAKHYFDRGRPKKALKSLTQAKRGKLTPGYRRQIPQFERKVRLAVKEREAEFEGLVGKAKKELASQQFREAAAHLAQAARLDPPEFERQQLARDRVNALIGDGQGRLSQGEITKARQVFEEAKKILPGRADVSDALDRIESRERSYQQSKREGDRAMQDKDWNAAIEHYNRARESHPEFARRDNLMGKIDQITALRRESPVVTDTPEARRSRDQARSRVLFLKGRRLTSQGSYQEAEGLYRQAIEAYKDNRDAQRALRKSRLYRPAAQAGRSDFDDWQRDRSRKDLLEQARQQLTRAAGLDLRRFQRDGSGKLLEEIDELLGMHFEIGTVREAVRLIYQGQVETAIESLERARDEGGLGNLHLHAFLGVAYATLAFRSTGNATFKELSSQALEQFRFTRSQDSDYQLPFRLVSPLVLQLFSQAEAAPE
jgi:tetratricopeptide (TPR) repeat protein